MEFNITTIDAASNAMFRGTPDEQRNANSFLIAWQNSPGSEMLAFQILQNSQTSVYSKNTSCAIIRNYILRRFYSKLDANARLQFRENTLLCLSSNFQVPLIVRNIISAIVLISLYEWPENWQAFPFDIYPFPQNNDQASRIKFFIELFNELINQVLSSNLIDPTRRIFLVSRLSQITSQIFPIVVPALGVENTNKEVFEEAMKLLLNLLNISPIENFQNENVLNFILSSFQYNESNESYHIEWLKFADKLLLKHPGRKTLIPIFAKPILTVASQIETHSSYLSHFIVRFLTKYSEDLVIFGIKETKEANSNEMLQVLAKQYLMTLKSPLLNSSDIYDIWYLWLDLFRSDKIDIPTEGENKVTINSPLFEMISFDAIINPLLEMLVLSSIGGYVAQKVVFKTMAALYDLYADKICNILLNSPPVPQICLAMALLWNKMEENKQIEIATSLYSKVLPNKGELLSPSALFAMTFCTTFLSKSADAQNSLAEILCELLKANNPVFLEPVSRSLNYLSENLQNIFIINNEMLLSFLIANIKIILSNSMNISDGKNGIRIFKAVSRVSMLFTDEGKRNGIFAGLSKTVLEYLEAQPTLLYGLHCLSSQPDKSPIFQFTIEKLLSLCQAIFNEQFNVPDAINLFFKAMSKALVSLPFESIRNIFVTILGTLFQKPNLVCQTFSLIEIMRVNYAEIEQLLPNLMTSLILPYITARIANATEVKSITDAESQASNENFVEFDSEFFSMLSKFTPQVFGAPQIIQAYLFGIRDMRLDVVKSSTASLMQLIGQITPINNLISFFQTFRRSLLNSLFVALFDMLHSTSFSAHTKLLRFFFNKSMNISFELAEKHQDNSVDMNLFEREFCEEICHVLNLNMADENIISMLRNLFSTLKTHYLTKMFKDAIKDFLITSNRTTNDGIMKIEEQSEANQSKTLIEVEQPFVDE